jgi:TetR/AcrR family transcriptional repressor of nem operon
VVEAREAGDVSRSVVAQLEGKVLPTKLVNDPAQLETLWRNCLALLGAPAGTLTPD